MTQRKKRGIAWLLSVCLLFSVGAEGLRAAEVADESVISQVSDEEEEIDIAGGEDDGPLIVQMEEEISDNGELSTYIITDMDGHELSLDSGSDTDVNGSTYASLPSSYDPRVTTNVNGKKTTTSVKNQGSRGICWSYTMAAVAESNLLLKTGTSYNFSERHLVWFTQNPVTSSGGMNDGANNTTQGSGSSSVWSLGGNWQKASATLFRGNGAVNESVSSTYLAFPNTTTMTGLSVPESYRYKSSAYLKNAVEIANPNMSLSQRKTAIKSAIVEYGAVGTNVYMTSSSDTTYYNSSKASYNYTGSSGVNHAVTIVGWNDNYSASNFRKKPAGNGAWLIKNSWGTSYGESGYVWVSYYDVHAGDNAYYVEMSTSGYDNTYQYDGTLATNGINSTLANVFKASGNETLKAVGLTALIGAGTYTVKVYVSNSKMSDPTAGTLMEEATTVYTTDGPGVFTIPLKKSVSLYTGQYYSIVVTCSGGGYVNFEYGDSYKVSAGQTYMKVGSSWIDATNVQSKYPSTFTKKVGNACIKAFTNDTVFGTATASDCVELKKSLSAGSTATVSGSLPSSATGTMTWKSTNTSVATVSSAGKITAVGSGDAVVYAMNSKGTTYLICRVTVSGSASGVSSVAFSSDAVTMDKGGYKMLTYKILPSTAADTTMICTSSDTSVVKVGIDNSTQYVILQAVGTGRSVLTLKTADGKYTDTCVVTVNGAPATSISVPSTATAYVGKTTTLKATMKPSDTTDKVTWTSSNTSVATVNSSGQVTGKKLGTATITAISSSGTCKASCKVTVTLATPSVTLSNTSTGTKVSWGAVSGASGYYVYRKTSGGSFAKIKTTTSTSYTDTSAKAGTTYYYTVRAYYGSTMSSYVTNATIKRMTQPSVTLSNSSTGVKISWGKVTGASGYYVYRRTSSTGSWTRLKSTTGTSYTDTTAKTGTTYYYTVKAYSGSYASSYITNKTIKYLAQPSVTLSNTSSGVKVSWGKVTGASGYYVYRKTTSGSWTKIKTTTSTSYTDTSAKNGTTYYYTVRAYYDSTLSSYVTTKSIKRLAQPGVTLSNTSSGVKISWGKVTGASGYYVYRRTSSTGSWTKLKTTTGTSYTDTSAKAGTTYYYTVKAYSGSSNSSYITNKTIKRLTQPSVTLSKTSSGIKVSWGKVTGASGYYVYRRTSSGSWTKLKTTTGTSYTDTTAKVGTTYYYTVKAYSDSSASSYVTNKTIKR